MNDWPGFAPPYVTALPSNEAEGMEIYWEVDGTNGVAWHLRFNGTLSKWVFLGGPPLWAQIDTSEATTSTTYAALTTAGPSIVMPGAGLFLVGLGTTVQASAQNFASTMSYDIGGTGAVDADALLPRGGSTVGSNLIQVPSRFNRKTFATAVTLTAKYKTESGTSTFSKRWMSLLPVTVDPV